MRNSQGATFRCVAIQTAASCASNSPVNLPIRVNKPDAGGVPCQSPSTPGTTDGAEHGPLPAVRRRRPRDASFRTQPVRREAVARGMSRHFAPPSWSVPPGAASLVGKMTARMTSHATIRTGPGPVVRIPVSCGTCLLHVRHLPGRQSCIRLLDESRLSRPRSRKLPSRSVHRCHTVLPGFRRFGRGLFGVGRAARGTGLSVDGAGALSTGFRQVLPVRLQAARLRPCVLDLNSAR